MSPLILPAVLVAAVLLLASVLSSKAARLGVPALLLFLGVGMLAGSDGPGGIHFDNPTVAQGMGVVALAFILFGGGLTTRWEDVRPVAVRGAALATVGVLATAGLTGVFAWQVAGLPLPQGLLLGAIVSSTDAAAVFSVLRSRHLGLAPRLRSLLEFESGSNDPMAVFLTLSLITWITDPQATLWWFLVQFPWQMAMGAAVGIGMGVLMSLAVNHAWLDYDGLYPVLTIGLVLLTYAAAESVAGNPFLAVYVAGISMRRREFLHKGSLLRFHDGVAWLMQVLMFLTLGLQVFPSKLPAVAGVGLGVALFLMLVARPLAVVLTLLPTRAPWREQVLVAWVGLRGAAPIILGTFPLVANVSDATLIFELVFFIVLMSALVQGTSIAWVARRLGLATGLPGGEIDLLDLVATSGRDLVDVRVAAGAPAAGRRLMDLRLPAGSLVVVVEREGLSIVPSGGTVIQAGDRLVVLAAHRDRPAVEAIGT